MCDRARCCVPPRDTQKGVQLMVARLRVMCLGLGHTEHRHGVCCGPLLQCLPLQPLLLSSLPLLQWRLLQTSRLQLPRLQWRLCRMYTRPIRRGTEGQTPPNPPRTNKRWMRKSANTGDGAVPRSRNRSRDIGSGNRSENASGILAMNGCGDRLCRSDRASQGRAPQAQELSAALGWTPRK